MHLALLKRSIDFHTTPFTRPFNRPFTRRRGGENGMTHMMLIQLPDKLLDGSWMMLSCISALSGWCSAWLTKSINQSINQTSITCRDDIMEVARRERKHVWWSVIGYWGRSQTTLRTHACCMHMQMHTWCRPYADLMQHSSACLLVACCFLLLEVVRC